MYDIDKLLEASSDKQIRFFGKSFSINKSYKNYKKTNKQVAKADKDYLENHEKYENDEDFDGREFITLRITVQGILGDAALEHLNAHVDDISADGIENLLVHIHAAASGKTVEEMREQFRKGYENALRNASI